jgi:hypothetical protein
MGAASTYMGVYVCSSGAFGDKAIKVTALARIIIVWPIQCKKDTLLLYQLLKIRQGDKDHYELEEGVPTLTRSKSPSPAAIQMLLV